MPEEITLHWLFQHVPVRGWVAIAGALVTVFGAGVFLANTAFVKELFGAKVTSPAPLPAGVARDVKVQFEALVSAHTVRMEALNKAYLEEQRKAADETLIPSYRREHAEVATRLRQAIDDERRAFTAQMEAVRAMMGGGHR